MPEEGDTRLQWKIAVMASGAAFREFMREMDGVKKFILDIIDWEDLELASLDGVVT